MRMKTNISQTADVPFDPIDPGWYEVEVIGAEPESSSTGKPYLAVELTIIGSKHVGRHLWDEVFMTESAGWRSSQFLKAFGIEPTEEIETEDVVGKRVMVKVRIDKGIMGSRRNLIVQYRQIKEVAD